MELLNWRVQARVKERNQIKIKNLSSLLSLVFPKLARELKSALVMLLSELEREKCEAVNEPVLSVREC